ncbi:peptidoglycan-binding domain-containing protein [uncultured Paracoccus sp.]|uniref:peptidoglycan-binding domain-containing protein n=1 Tax=uncultured Paracoccus sp. TaxID=189685 RepID=UPI002632210B|nr:peptidoglycan-binding domain-containing protein [uncultured Paracoccus sp.]
MVGLKLGVSAALASAMLLSAPAAARAQEALGQIIGAIAQGLTAQQAAEQERALWEAVQKRNSVAAYQAYLDDYPSGRYADTARDRIRQATGREPVRTAPSPAQQAEAQLQLNRNQRQQIQRDLTALGYDTRGIDGAFGSGTRNAIRSWQTANDLAATAYVNADQIALLRRQAADRATPAAGNTQAAGDASSSQTELALNLTRTDRQRIQRQLTTQGHNAGVADGLFGSATRKAIRSWQEKQGYRQTGYLNAPQLAKLRDLATARTAPRPGSNDVEEQLLTLTRAERQEAQRLLVRLGHDTRGTDGTFGPATRDAIARWQGTNGWAATGYLNADQFRALRKQGERATATAPAADRNDSRADEQAWARAIEAKTLAGYQAYLAAHPRGAHAAEARQVVDRTVAEYARTEASLMPDAGTRRLLEERLKAMGYEPGEVDGAFTTATRAALREYQKRNELSVTGYVSQQLLMKMLMQI